MEILSPLFSLLFRSFVILMPMTIAWLAFRRLTLSKSNNAWIYAVTCLFNIVTAAGLMPWALGIDKAGWLFFILAAFCPAIWLYVITICDVPRRRSYETPVDDKAPTFTSKQRLAPLVLENPQMPGTAVPVFKHLAKDTGAVTFERRKPTGLPMKMPEAPKPRSLMDIAREMRGKETSDDRRPKMLPAPNVKSLTYIKN